MSDDAVLVDIRPLAERPGYLSRAVVNLGILLAAACAVAIFITAVFAAITRVRAFGIAVGGLVGVALVVLGSPASLVVASLAPLPRHRQRFVAVAIYTAWLSVVSLGMALVTSMEVAWTVVGAGVGVAAGLFAWLPQLTPMLPPNA